MSDPITDKDLKMWDGVCAREDGHKLVANANTIRRFVETVRRLREENERLNDSLADELCLEPYGRTK